MLTFAVHKSPPEFFPYRQQYRYLLPVVQVLIRSKNFQKVNKCKVFCIYNFSIEEHASLDIDTMKMQVYVLQMTINKPYYEERTSVRFLGTTTQLNDCSLCHAGAGEPEERMRRHESDIDILIEMIKFEHINIDRRLNQLYIHHTSYHKTVYVSTSKYKESSSGMQLTKV